MFAAHSFDESLSRRGSFPSLDVRLFLSSSLSLLSSLLYLSPYAISLPFHTTFSSFHTKRLSLAARTYGPFLLSFFPFVVFSTMLYPFTYLLYLLLAYESS